MSQLPDYGTSFNLWRASAPEAWRAYTQHAFVKGLGDGSLPQKAFLHYLVQDYVFLIHFSRAWALVVVKSETLDEMKIAAGTVDALVNGEMQLHVRICARHGISEQQLFDAAEEAENLAYTRYVLDAGFSGDILDLLTALAPCVLGYGEIGALLKPSASPDNPYLEWIDTYADADYQTVCQNVGRMIDDVVARRLGDAPQSVPRWQSLCDQFAKATELEARFWDMGLRGA